MRTGNVNLKGGINCSRSIARERERESAKEDNRRREVENRRKYLKKSRKQQPAKGGKRKTDAREGEWWRQI